MFKKIILGAIVVVVLIVAIFCAIVALQPSHFQIERSATINAPAPVVFSQVNDFHKWEAWSPWAKLDPSMKQTYLGSHSGGGAIYSWSGNNQVGEGRMTITESRPTDLIRIELDFIKPFSATNSTEFTFTPQGNQTNVKWSMSGENNFVAKAFGLIMNMDKTVGGDFERGLAQLKTVSEAANK